jgi:hypothetical protein
MSDIAYYHNFVTSLVFTIVVETCVIFAILKGFLRNREVSSKRLLFAGIFVNFATVPYVWFIIPGVMSTSSANALIISEPVVFVIEAIFYWFVLEVDLKTALLLSLVANATSYFLGPLLRDAGLWIYW